MAKFFLIIRNLISHYSALSLRERVLVGLMIAGVFGYFINETVVSVRTMVDEGELKVQIRQRDLDSVTKVAARYKNLKTKRDTLEQHLAASQMDVETVRKQLNSVMQQTLQNDNYELRNGQKATPFGTQYSKNESTLILKSTPMKQLVSILYEIEHGKRPLFISKISLIRSAQPGEYNATVDVYSINRNEGGDSSSNDEAKLERPTSVFSKKRASYRITSDVPYVSSPISVIQKSNSSIMKFLVSQCRKILSA